jgi:hypothetical protein
MSAGTAGQQAGAIPCRPSSRGAAELTVESRDPLQMSAA